MGRWTLGLIAALAALGLAGQAHGACQVLKLADVPLEMTPSRAYTRVKINGQDARLIVDTGAFYSTLSLTSTAHLKLEIWETDLEVQGLTGKAKTRVTSAKDFALLGVTLHDIGFVLAGSDFEPDVDGLLGNNVVSARDAEFDLGHGVLRLMQSKDCGKAPLAYWAPGAALGMIAIDHIEGADNSIRGMVSVNGKTLRAMFDTGAPKTLLTRRGARRVGLKPGDPTAVSAGPAGGVNGVEKPTWIAPVASLDIGGEQIKNTRLRFGDFESDDLDMIIGLDFFLSHHLYLAKDQRRLYFTYNGGKVFDLSTGGAAGATDERSPEPPKP